jgi:hypothetical protein
MLDGHFDHTLDIAGYAYVRGNGKGSPSGRDDFVARFLQRAEAPPDDGNARPASSEGFGHPAAYARPASRDQSHLPPEGFARVRLRRHRCVAEVMRRSVRPGASC